MSLENDLEVKILQSDRFNSRFKVVFQLFVDSTKISFFSENFRFPVVLRLDSPLCGTC